MLKKKQQEELTQKIICYGTLLLCFVYFLKFVRGLATRKRRCTHQVRPCARVPYPECEPVVPPPPETETELQSSPRQRRHRRKRNRHRHMAEQWQPRDSCCDEHEFDDQYE